LARDKGKRGNPPKHLAGAKAIKSAPTGVPDPNTLTPKFCLAHIGNGHCLEHLTTAQRSAFALAIQKRCEMTWQQITFADRHGLGLETLPAGQIKPQIPAKFTDREKFLVLRYDGTMPMIGARTLDVFHVRDCRARG
jgi:hypothetical protein